jgi:hypothetical protein
MSYRLTHPGDPPGDETALGYAEYGCGKDADGQAPAPRRRPSAEGYAGSYGQHDFVGSARRSDLRSVQRYHDRANPGL